MAIAFDANLGSSDANTGTTFTIVTTAAAAAASRIVVLISFWNTNATASVGGVNDGTAYTRDKSTDNGNDVFEIWSRHASGGLASGSTITITLTGTTGAGGCLAGAASFTGIASTSAVVSTGSATGTGASWSSGSATNTGQADALYLGGAGNEDPTAGTTSSPTSPALEIHDRYRTADQQGFTSAYKIVSTVAANSVAGTFSNSASTANTGALVIYAAAAGAAAPTHFLATLGAGG